jgi:CRP-like cAMP-binding protein
MDEPLKIPFGEISKIPLFAGLTETDLRRLLQAAHRKRHMEGEFFFLQGDPAERMFVLIQGRVKLSQSGPDGLQVLIRVNTPVSLFALVAMTSAESYPVTAQAAEDSQAIYWTRTELMGFVQEMPQIAMNAMRIMAEQVQELQERFRQASTERVERRLARTLIRLASQAGRKIEEGILIDLPLTRQDLAEMTGTTLYTVSRILSLWEEQGLVISMRERVIIRFPHGLVKIAEDLST